MLIIIWYVCNIIQKKFIIALFSLTLRDGVVSHHILDKALDSFDFQYCFPCIEILVFRRILALLFCYSTETSLLHLRLKQYVSLFSACTSEPYLIRWCDNVIREVNAFFFEACCKILLCTEGIDTWYGSQECNVTVTQI